MDAFDAELTLTFTGVEAGLPATPIIALTANAFHHQVAEYAAAGMDDHVSKPIDVQTLSLAIARVPQPAQVPEAVAYSA